MENLPAFLAYAALYRLAIIAVGALSIYCGYRLFSMSTGGQGNAEISASFAGNEFVMKQAAPGSFFILFGTVVVGLMIYQGNPEFTLEDVPAPAPGTVSAPLTGPATSRAHVKSDGEAMGEAEYNTRFGEAGRLYASGRESEALDIYHALLRQKGVRLGQAAYPIAALAWDAYQRKAFDTAVAYALLAIEIAPDGQGFVDTLAQSYLHSNNPLLVRRTIERWRNNGDTLLAERIERALIEDHEQ